MKFTLAISQSAKTVVIGNSPKDATKRMYTAVGKITCVEVINMSYDPKRGFVACKPMKFKEDNLKTIVFVSFGLGFSVAVLFIMAMRFFNVFS